jgi:hypothetical protein
MGDVTAILLNYKRRPNIDVLVERLRSQTIAPDILLVNNSNKRLRVAGADVVEMPRNQGSLSRFIVAPFVLSEWLLFMDDDLAPATHTFVEDALRVGAQHEGIVGVFGARLRKSPPHYDYTAPPGCGAVEIVKGRFMLFRRKLLDTVPLGLLPTMSAAHGGRGCDIFMSLAIGKGKPVHWLDKGLVLEELPAMGVGLEEAPDHYTMRESFTAKCVKRLL